MRTPFRTTRGLRVAAAAMLIALSATTTAAATVHPSGTGGSVELHGEIAAAYGALGGPAGVLGLPAGGERVVRGGAVRYADFQHGSVWWSAATGAREVRGAIRDAWLARGGADGPLGLPVTDEYDVPGGRESDFQGGFLRWDAVTGQVREGRGQVLTTGVAYRRIDDPRGPFSSRVLTLDPSGRGTLDVGLAQGRLAGLETTSSIARRHRALAAVNGDFFLPSGRPVHLYAEDGHLVQAPALVENALGATGRGVGVQLGRPSYIGTVRDVRGRREAPLARVNAGAPVPSELSLVTAAAAGLETPPAHACSARLRPFGKPRVLRGQATASFSVQAVACGAEPMPAAGQAVLSAPLGGQHADFVRGLARRGRVQVAWSLGWDATTDATGGNAVLVADGRLTGRVDGTDPFFARHPRTGIGVTADGQVLLVTVDGRQRGHSAGMTLREFGEHMRSLGAVRAMLLDGGGSTVMNVRGQVANRPSDGTERPVATALLVLDRVDAARPEPWRGAASAQDTTAWARELTDPASTGGWARAQRRAGVRLPEELDAALG